MSLNQEFSFSEINRIRFPVMAQNGKKKATMVQAVLLIQLFAIIRTIIITVTSTVIATVDISRV